MFDPLESRPAKEANYIVYFLDGAGKIRDAEWLAASDDGDALEQVRRLGVTCGCELWQRSRRVAGIPSSE